MKLSVRISALAGAAIACCPISMFGQSEAKAGQPAYTHVAIVQLKTDTANVGQWEAATREYAAICRRSKWPTPRSVWQVVVGQTAEFHIVTPVLDLAEMDETNSPGEAAEMAQWVARASRCVESRRTMILENHHDLSIPPKQGATPKLLELITYRVRSGENENFMAVRRDLFLPVYKKLEMTGIAVHRIRFGGDRTGWAITRMQDSWADIGKANQMMQQTLGEDFPAFVEKMDAATEGGREWTVLRYRPDLSYEP